MLQDMFLVGSGDKHRQQQRTSEIFVIMRCGREGYFHMLRILGEFLEKSGANSTSCIIGTVEVVLMSPK